MLDSPQRLQRVWVLLWRLPKLEVPFAIESVSPFYSGECTCRCCKGSGARRTHLGLGTTIERSVRNLVNLSFYVENLGKGPVSPLAGGVVDLLFVARCCRLNVRDFDAR